MTEIVIERGGYDVQAALDRAKARPEYYQEAVLLDVARRISDAMGAQGVSRADLAKNLGVSPAYITKMLRGRENFSLQTLARIAWVLGKKWELELVGRAGVAVAFKYPAPKKSRYSARVAERAGKR